MKFHAFPKIAIISIAGLLLSLGIAPLIGLANRDVGQSPAITMASLPESPPKTAVTDGWYWEDMSEHLPEREGRPVWAMARSGSYWYLTDGKPFDEGGWVMNTNGTQYHDITADIQAAGLNKVDEIIGIDGGVYFFEGITKRDASWNVVFYDYKNFSFWDDATVDGDKKFALAAFESYKEFASPVSYTGELKINSERYELIKETDSQELSLFIIVLLVNGIKEGKVTIEQIREEGGLTEEGIQMLERLLSIKDEFDNEEDVAYSLRHVSPADGKSYFPIKHALTETFWLTAVFEPYLENYQNTTRFFKNGEGQFMVDVTDQIGPMAKVHAIASNENHILIAGTSDPDSDVTDRLYYYDGASTVDLSAQLADLPFNNWNRVIMAWNGKSWMILSGKNLVRFDGKQLESLGRTRDLFLSIAGAPNGQFFLGGLVSTQESDTYSEPMHAKFVIVSEGEITSLSQMMSEEQVSDEEMMEEEETGEEAMKEVEGDEDLLLMTNEEKMEERVETMVKITAPVMDEEMRLGESMTFAGEASSPHGISSIELYLDGGRYRICSFPDTPTVANCQHDLMFATSTDVGEHQIKVVATDSEWTGVQTDPLTVMVMDGEALANATVSVTFTESWESNGKATYAVEANYDGGINQMRVYANDELVGSCSFDQAKRGVCGHDLSIEKYGSGNQVLLKTMIQASDGNEGWHGYHEVMIP